MGMENFRLGALYQNWQTETGKINIPFSGLFVLEKGFYYG